MEMQNFDQVNTWRVLDFTSGIFLTAQSSRQFVKIERGK